MPLQNYHVAHLEAFLSRVSIDSALRRDMCVHNKNMLVDDVRLKGEYSSIIELLSTNGSRGPFLSAPQRIGPVNLNARHAYLMIVATKQT